MAKVIVVKKYGTIVFTRDYTTGLIFQTKVKQGTTGIVTADHRGWFSRSFDIRLKDGKFLRRVPFKYFET